MDYKTIVELIAKRKPKTTYKQTTIKMKTKIQKFK